MSSHPDADAFMRGYLRNPPDKTARLVFADWLEETGTPWNRAWAYYIRLKAEADAYPFGSPERKELERQAAEYVPHIAARLTIPASLFVGYPKSLLQLLPGPNITVKLDGFTPTQAAISCMTWPLAELYHFFPLDRQGMILLLAVAGPHYQHAMDDLEHLLALRITWVVASGVDIRAAIRNLGPLLWPDSLVGDLVGDR
jgi:uncharacterized protein (TIGR02996 family)